MKRGSPLPAKPKRRKQTQLAARGGRAVTRRQSKVARRKAALPGPVNERGWRRVWDTYAGQWQQDVEVDAAAVLTFSAVFACIRLIATDIGKLRIRLVQELEPGIWQETTSAAFSPVLRKPNPHQIRIKFYEQWIQSKLITGNAYILKSRDDRGVVTQLRVIDASLVQPLISESGAVYYRIAVGDQLLALDEDIVVPAREIIHDVDMTPNHPLVGVSRIGACGLAATQGLKIQNNSAQFFANQSRAGFVLTAPGAISNETAARLKASWEQNYSGANYGRTAVLGDGLEPKTFTLSADDSQLIEQLNWTATDVCRAFGVPAYKIGVGPMPAYNNIEGLQQAYYNDCLQELLECIELLLDEGLGLEQAGLYGTEFDLDGLMRMDTMTQARVNGEEIKAGYLAPDEARARRNLLPVPGGASPMMQQQNFSLAALAKRDARDDPFAAATPTPPTEPDEPVEPDEPEDPEAPEVPEPDDSKEFALYLGARLDALVEAA
jgi:HK97 family phage portal protein